MAGAPAKRTRSTLVIKLLFLLLKGAKLGKVLLTIGSMLLMVWT